MIPTVLLLALMHMQAQRQQTIFTPDEVKIGDCLKVVSADGVAVKIPCPEPPPTEQFDVAPILVLDRFNEFYMTCTDQSRVLLKSEDGKGHCLTLRKP